MQTITEQIAAFTRPLTALELAHIVGVHQRVIYRQVRTGKLPALRIGNQLRFEPATTLAWANALSGGHDGNV